VRVWSPVGFSVWCAFEASAPVEIFARSLHDALPISDEHDAEPEVAQALDVREHLGGVRDRQRGGGLVKDHDARGADERARDRYRDRKSTRLNSSHVKISYAGFCLKKKTNVYYTSLGP